MTNNQLELAQKLHDAIYKENQVKLAALRQSREVEIKKYYVNSYAIINKKLKKLYDIYSKNGVLTNNEASIYNSMKTLKGEIERELVETQLLTIDKLKELSCEQFNESFFRTGYATTLGGQITTSFGPIPVDALEYLAESPLSKLSKSKLLLNDVKPALTKIKADIGKSITMGYSYPKLSREIGNSLGLRHLNGKKYKYTSKGTLARLMRIARTEGQRAMVAGQLLGYERSRELGIEFDEIWNAALDNRTRPDHLDLHGQIKKDGGWFVPSLQIVATAPLHTGVASFDINCRCRISAHLKDLPFGTKEEFNNKVKVLQAKRLSEKGFFYKLFKLGV